jgi:hypothetical protein
MTRTSLSTAAGADGGAAPPDLLAGWLRRAQSVPAASAWVLRGSLVTAALCPGARAPADVDYLLPGAPSAPGEPAVAAALEAALRAIAAAPDPGPPLEIVAIEPIWAETPWPGLRAHVAATGGGRFQVDLAAGDPMCVPPWRLTVAGVEAVLACAPETLFAWKLHGLCEHGTGRWRAKDLFDLDLLWRHAALDRAATREAVTLAFSSRQTPLGALDDFRARESWGCSRGGVRKWRALAKAYAGLDDFAATRARVRAAVDELL